MLPGMTPNPKVFREILWDDYSNQRFTAEQVHDTVDKHDLHMLSLILFRKGVLTGEEFLESMNATGRFEFVG